MQNELEIKSTFGLSMDFDDLFSQLPIDKPKEIDPNEDRFIIHATTIDNKTVKRVRHKVTPAVCLACGVDFVKEAYKQGRIREDEDGKPPTFDKLPHQIQEILINAVRRHTVKNHNNSEALILSESELPKKWLDTSA